MYVTPPCANRAAGDLWYFPANVPHSIVGLGPSGCTYVTGYNAPDFNELTSFSASSWLATVPLATLAQVRMCTLELLLLAVWCVYWCLLVAGHGATGNTAAAAAADT